MAKVKALPFLSIDIELSKMVLNGLAVNSLKEIFRYSRKKTCDNPTISILI